MEAIKTGIFYRNPTIPYTRLTVFLLNLSRTIMRGTSDIVEVQEDILLQSNLCRGVWHYPWCVTCHPFDQASFSLKLILELLLPRLLQFVYTTEDIKPAQRRKSQERYRLKFSPFLLTSWPAITKPCWRSSWCLVHSTPSLWRTSTEKYTVLLPMNLFSFHRRWNQHQSWLRIHQRVRISTPRWSVSSR